MRLRPETKITPKTKPTKKGRKPRAFSHGTNTPNPQSQILYPKTQLGFLAKNVPKKIGTSSGGFIKSAPIHKFTAQKYNTILGFPSWIPHLITWPAESEFLGDCWEGEVGLSGLLKAASGKEY